MSGGSWFDELTMSGPNWKVVTYDFSGVLKHHTPEAKGPCDSHSAEVADYALPNPFV